MFAPPVARRSAELLIVLQSATAAMLNICRLSGFSNCTPAGDRPSIPDLAAPGPVSYSAERSSCTMPASGLPCSDLFFLLLACAMPVAAQEIRRDDFVKPQSDVTLVQDPNAPISFRPPESWLFVEGQRWGDHETTLWFEDANSNLKFAFYYQYPLNPKTETNRWPPCAGQSMPR